MAVTKYRIDPDRVKKAWKRANYPSLKDVFRDADGNENAFMRYDSAQKQINSGEVSSSIMNFLCERLNCPKEYLTGELTDRDIEDWGIPSKLFSAYQDFLDMSDEDKEQYYLNLILDLGIADKWIKMNNRQRSYCHLFLRESINWLLDYVQPDENTYEEMFDFFAKTGIGLEPDPEKRQRIFQRLADNCKVSIKGL